MSNVQYSGPYSSQVYNAANMIANGGSGAPYSPSILQAANKVVAAQPTANQDTGGNVLGSSTVAGPVAPTIDPATQAAINQQTSFLQSALGRLPGQLDTAKSNIQGQYGTNLNELNTGETQAKGQYQQGTNQNSQQYVTNKNQITDQSASGLHSLLRLLGLHGAGGSSDALYSAPQAVATQATQERSGAGQTYGQNQQGLDTNWNNYETGVGQSKQKLNDWLSQQLNAAQATNDTTRQGILQQIAGLQPSVATAQPYLDQSTALNNEVDQLGKLNPTYNGTAPTYTPPSVASYTVAPGATPVQTQGAAADSYNTPFLSLLLGNQKKNQQPAFNF